MIYYLLFIIYYFLFLNYFCSLSILQEVPVCCCFSNDGSLLLIGLDTGSWKVLDFQSKKTLVEYHDTGNDAIECLQFSPNGLMLAVGNRAGIIHLYQVSNGKFNRIGRCMV